MSITTESSVAPAIHHEDLELCRRLTNGEKTAMKEFYDKYKSLIWYFSRRLIATYTDNPSIDIDDIAQEGFQYALERVESYDGSIPFGNWLSIYFERQMRKRVDDQAFGVRIPDNLRQVVWRIDAINASRLYQGSGTRRPLITERTKSDDEPDIPLTPYVRSAISAQTLLRKRVGSLERGFSPHSEESPANPYILEQRQELRSFTCEPLEPVEKITEDNMMASALRAVLDQLSERERVVIEMRYGLNGDEPKTFDEIGKLFDVSRERIRQIESKTMAKLRHPSRSQSLRDYLE